MFFPGLRYPYYLWAGDSLEITYKNLTFKIGPVKTATTIRNETELLTLLGL